MQIPRLFFADLRPFKPPVLEATNLIYHQVYYKNLFTFTNHTDTVSQVSVCDPLAFRSQKTLNVNLKFKGFMIQKILTDLESS